MAPLPTDLPPGLSARPLTMSDAAAVTAVIVAEELEDLGTAAIDEADIISFWERPSFDLAASTVGIFEGGLLVAYAELVDRVFGAAAVLPSHRCRGLGTALAAWMRAGASERGLGRIGTQVAQGSPGDRLLASLGYAEGYTAWDLALPSREALAAVEPPPGYAIREARQPDEIEDSWNVIEDAFLEWSKRERKLLVDWTATTAGRADFAPWRLRVATDASGVVVAAVVIHVSGETALIDQLATRRDQRGRGLGSALITDAVRTSAQHGATAWTISTDSRSGARTLYEQVGMRVTSTWVNRVAALG